MRRSGVIARFAEAAVPWRLRRGGRRAALAIVLAVLLPVPAFAGGPSANAAPSRCDDLTIPVSLVAMPVSVHGRLCHPDDGPGETVQVLVHGGTYDSVYWDFPYQPETYSYVRAANRRGYSTLNIDRLGYGQSSQVPSALLTGTVHANVIHQIIGKLREGRVGSVAFSRVLLVGHSMGSGVSTLEAATYRDVDGVMLTGMAHPLAPEALVEALTQWTYPAILSSLPSGWTSVT